MYIPTVIYYMATLHERQCYQANVTSEDVNSLSTRYPVVV